MDRMVDGWSAEQVRAAEAPHLAAGEPLMQRASDGLAEAVRGLLRDSGRWPGAVVLLVGSGSNGGDALFAGAALAADGCPVTVVPSGSRVHEAGLAAATAAGAEVDDVDAWSTPDGVRRRLVETGAAVVPTSPSTSPAGSAPTTGACPTRPCCRRH
jgi:NAD(P)H-hydrate epimerase